MRELCNRKKIAFRHQEISKELDWDADRHLNELVIEDPLLLREMLAVTTDTSDTARFCFAVAGRTLGLGDEVELIGNPARLNFSNRRALAALNKDLVQISTSEDFYLRTGELKTELQKYLDDVIAAGDFAFTTVVDDNFTIDALTKVANLRIVGESESFVENLTGYLAMMAELTGVQVAMILNLRSLLTEEEMLQFHHNLNNHQLNVLLLETTDRGQLEGVPRIIVDRDGCEL